MDISRVHTPAFPDELGCVGGAGLDTEELWGGCDPLCGADLGGGLLDAVDDDGEEEFQALLADRSSNRSPCNQPSAFPQQQQDWQHPMRGSYSLNDLTLLQQPAAQPALPLHWAGLNSKLVSAKPKLEPVPEGGPSHMDGGALHLQLLPLVTADAQTLGGVKAAPAAAPHCGLVHASSSPALPMDLNHLQLQKRAAAAAQQAGRDSPLENESSSDSMPRSVPSSSCNTLSTQLQMTHVTSESQLSSLEQQHQLAPRPSGLCGKGAVQGSTAAVETFRQTCTLPTESGPGDLQGEGEGSSGVQQCPGGRMPSNLPLRKSQSAVELGSWRDNFCWDTSEEGQYVGHPQLSGCQEERSAPKIQRYREQRTQRKHARAPSYQTSRAKGSSPPLCGSPRVEFHNGRRLPRSASGGALHWGADQGSAEAHALPGGMSSGASSSALDSHAYMHGGAAASAPSHMGGHMRSRSFHSQQPSYGLSHGKHGEPFPQYGGFSAYGQPQMSSHVGSPQGGSYMQAAQRSRSFQSGLSSATYFPPPVPPSCKLGMIGGANLPAASSNTNLTQQDGSNSPLGSSPPSHFPLLPSLLSRPPRMLAPCLPASHPLAGPSPTSGSIFMPGNLSQQLNTSTGSSCVAPQLSLSGNSMQAPLPNLPPTGQTIFTIGSARTRSKPTAAPPSPPLHNLQSSPLQEASTCASPAQPCMPAAMMQGSNKCVSSGPMQLA